MGDNNLVNAGNAIDEIIEEHSITGEFSYTPEHPYGKTPYPMPPGKMGLLVENIMQRSRYPHINFAIPCAISLGGALGCNRFHLDGTYSNMYVMVIGASGTGKNVHMDEMGFIADEMRHGFILKHDFGSDTAIFNAFKANPLKNLLFVHDEFSGFLGKMNVKNNVSTTGIEASLNKLFSLAGKLYKGKDNKSVESIEEIHSPCFSVLGGIQPEKLIPCLRAETLGSGLLGRFLPFFGCGEQTKNKARALITHPKLKELGMRLMSCAWQPRAVPLGMTPEARVYLEESNEANRSKMFLLPEGIERTLLGRRDEHIEKLCVALASMEYDGHVPTITMEQIKWSERIVDMVQLDYKDFVEDYLHTDEFSMLILKITKFIKSNGPAGCSSRDIQRKFHLKGQTFRSCLETLIDQEKIILAEYRSILKMRHAWVHEDHAEAAVARAENYTTDTATLKSILFKKIQ